MAETQSSVREVIPDIGGNFTLDQGVIEEKNSPRVAEYLKQAASVPPPGLEPLVSKSNFQMDHLSSIL
ncbi:hypothetical protein XANCAGTX0491_004184 [Xanthoria calcicola]